MAVRSKSYVVMNNPIVWQRAKLNGQRFFDGQSREKLCFAITLQAQHSDEPLFDKPISIDIVFYLKSTKALNRSAKTIHHAVRPDIDNLCKFILDAMNKVIFTDDKLICSLTAKKLYSMEPRTEFTITEME